MLQYGIIFMGIYPDISTLLVTPLKAEVGNTFYGARTCQAMNNPIRFIVQPFTIVYFGICGIIALKETKNTNNHIVIYANITVAV
jgi:hypothetical protein